MEDHRREFRQEQVVASFGAWQLGFRLGSQQVQLMGALAGAKVDLEQYANNYPTFPDYLKAFGLVE